LVNFNFTSQFLPLIMSVVNLRFNCKDYHYFSKTQIRLKQSALFALTKRQIYFNQLIQPS